MRDWATRVQGDPFHAIVRPFSTQIILLSRPGTDSIAPG
jgi:hypothetical protein